MHLHWNAGRDLLVNLDSAFLHDKRHSTDTPYSARIVLSALTATGKGMDEDMAALLSACACLVVAAPFSIFSSTEIDRSAFFLQFSPSVEPKLLLLLLVPCCCREEEGNMPSDDADSTNTKKAHVELFFGTTMRKGVVTVPFSKNYCFKFSDLNL